MAKRLLAAASNKNPSITIITINEIDFFFCYSLFRTIKFHNRNAITISAIVTIEISGECWGLCLRESNKDAHTYNTQWTGMTIICFFFVFINHYYVHFINCYRTLFQIYIKSNESLSCYKIHVIAPFLIRLLFLFWVFVSSITIK